MNAQDFDSELKSLFQQNLARCRIGPGQRGVVLPEGARLGDSARAGAQAHIGRGLMECCLRNARMPGGGMDGRADCGNTLRSPGAGTKRGGDPSPACHLGRPMRNGNPGLDGDRMVDQQRSVPGDMRPASGPSL
jgi:hypothetical protein